MIWRKCFDTPLRANSKTVERFSGEGEVTKMLAYLSRTKKASHITHENTKKDYAKEEKKGGKHMACG